MSTKHKTKWTEQEDVLLKELVAQQKQRNWVSISNTINHTYGINQWTGKQCRQRFVNCFSAKSKVKVQEWTLEQFQRLLTYFEMLGPQWSSIAILLQMRTQNNVKNKFYASARRLHTKLAKIIINNKKIIHKKLKFQSLIRVLYSNFFVYSCDWMKKISVQLRTEILKQLYLLQISTQKNIQEQIQIQSLIKMIEKMNNFNFITKGFRMNKICPLKTNIQTIELQQKQLKNKQIQLFNNFLTIKQREDESLEEILFLGSQGEFKSSNCSWFEQNNNNQIQHQKLSQTNQLQDQKIALAKGYWFKMFGLEQNYGLMQEANQSSNHNSQNCAEIQKKIQFNKKQDFKNEDQIFYDDLR